MNSQQKRKSEVYTVNNRRQSNNERTARSNTQSINRCGSKAVCVVVATLAVVLSIGVGIGLGIFLFPHIMLMGNTPGHTAIGIQTAVNSTEVILEETDDSGETSPVHVHLNSLRCGKLDPARSGLYFQYRSENQASDPTEQARKTRIVGGEKSSSHKLPWQASLWTGGHHTCGGSIIASNWILTAAHCTAVYPSPKNWTVYVGATYLTEMKREANFTQMASPTDVVSHPEFDEYTCLISGWGLLEEGGVKPNVLREATVKIIERRLCNSEDWLMGLVSDVMLCAGTKDGSIDACQGDSGGPLSCLRQVDGKFSLAGLVSWGIGCGEPYMPGVYTDLSKYKAWITNTVESTDKEYSEQQ